MRTEIAIISALTLVLSMPLAFGEIVETKGQNYDLVENFFIGEAVWESHPQRIMDGGWQNYALSNTGDKVIFNTNAVGSFVFDKNSCSYSIYGNGFDGEQIIPSVSAVATYLNNGQWQNLPVNNEACTVTVDRYEDGVYLTSTKVITEDITEDVFIPYTGTTENFYVNATNTNFDLVQSSNGTNIGYFNGETRVLESVEVEKFVQEIRLDIIYGFKETFKVWHDGSEELGISQTIHTGESITIADQTINIAELNGQSFDRQYIIDNEAEILELTDSVNYDFDTGIDFLSNVNIIFDGDYKVNMDFAEGDFIGYLEIDPTISITSPTSGTAKGYTVGTTTSNCNAGVDGTVITNDGFVGIGASYCQSSVMDFDISGIPDTATITSVIIDSDNMYKYYHGSTNCKFYDIDTNNIGSASESTLYSDARSGTLYLTDTTYCVPEYGTGYGNRYVVASWDLGSDAASDLTAELSVDDEWGVGVTQDSHTSYSGVPKGINLYSGTVTLTATYTVPIAPQPPTGLTTVTGVPVELDWTAPTDNGGSAITGYKVFRTLNEYALTELPDNSANSAGIDFTNNEFLTHGFESTTTADQSLEFDGSSDYVQLPQLATGNIFAVSAWVKVDVVGTHGILTDNAVSNGIYLTDGASGLRVGNTLSGGTDFNTNTHIPADGNFHHVVWNVNSPHEIWLDGTSLGTGGGAPINANFEPRMGFRSGGGMLDGVLDEVGVWDRNLSTSEVASLYAGASPSTISSGLVAYYDMETVTSSTISDVTSNNYDGTNNGAVAIDTSVTTTTIPDKSTNSISITTNSGTSTTGVIGTGVQNPQLSFTDSNLPDNTDDFSVGSWVKLDTSLTYEDDFSTDKGWTTSGSGAPTCTIDLTTDNRAEFSMASGSWTAPHCVDDLGLTLDDENFVLRFAVEIYSTFTTGANANIKIWLDDDGVVGGDAMGISINMNNLGANYDGIYHFANDGSAQTQAGSAHNGASAVNPANVGAQGYIGYFEIIRNNSNSMTVTEYSDSGYSNVVSTGTLSGGDYNVWGSGSWSNSNSQMTGVTGLSHLMFGLSNNDSQGGTWSMSLDDIEIHNGVTSVLDTQTKLLNLNDVTFNVGTTSASVDTVTTGTVTSEVVWDESTATNASFSGNTITGTGGTWGTAAKSIATYSTSDGMYVEMERPSGSYSVMFGFGNGAHTGGTYHFSTLDYGINMGGDVYESNSNVCNSCANLGAGTYKVNIATDGTITYWYKSPTGSYTTPFYTSSTTASGDYSVRVHIHTTYSALAEVTAQGLIPSTIISASGLTDNTSTPQHYTFTRSANDWTIYQNGASEATATDTTSLGGNVVTPTTITATGSYTQDYPIGSYDNNRQGAYIASTNSVLYDKEIDSVSFWLKKQGSPTGIAYVRAYSDSNTGTTYTTAHEFGSIDVSTLTTNYQKYTFSTGSYVGALYDTIGIEWTGTSTANTPVIQGMGSNQFDGTDTQRGRSTTSGWSPVSSHDIKWEVITGGSNQYTTHIDGMIDEYFINSDSLTSTEVEMAYDKGSEPTQITTTGGTTTEYDDSNVSGGNTYYYTVKATNAVGDSDFLTPFVSALAGTPPDVPTSVSSTINSPNTAPLDITVSWSAPTNVGTGTLTGFEIYRDSTLITTTGLVTSYTDTVPSGGGTFEYKLKAVSTHGTSGFSSTTSTTTPTVPPAPTNAPALAINNPNPSPLDIEVSWTEPASGGSIIQSYEIFRSADDVTYTSVGTVTDLDFTDTVPSAGTWYYKFTSINLVGSSGLSPSNSITTASVPSSPLNASSVIPSINSAPYDVTVSWDLPTSTGGSALTGYNVYRQTGTGAFSLVTTTTALGYVDTVPTALNQDYTFKIHAVNNVGESTGFTTTTITTGDVPDAPTLSFTTGTTALSWTVPNSDASITGYEIFRDGSSLTTVTTTTHSDFTPINFGQSYQYEVKAVSILGDSASSNSIVTTPETEITGMIVQGITGTGAVIDWNEPAYYQGQITSYNVYYSTPAQSANPTISAGTTTNTYSNFAPTLDYDTSYTFGVTINSPLGNSGFSNLVNATTNVDSSIVAYDPNTGGMNWFDIDSVSEQTVNVIEFQRETQNLNVNGTFTDVDTLQVGYPSWWDDMTCNIDYKFAQKTEQYVEGTDMTAVVNSADVNQQVIGFQFHDIDNEVIEVECAPQVSQHDDEVSAKYIMTQTNLSTGVPNIPLVTQIQAFQTGDYGTDGEFGALDIVGLFVILISMVGFNRLNPIVGVLLSASLVFGLSFFGIISLPTVLVGVVALVIFLAWGITRNR